MRIKSGCPDLNDRVVTDPIDIRNTGEYTNQEHHVPKKRIPYLSA
jgi:hypothetical protein